MGAEWYWVGCHLNVKDQNGNTGRISVLTSSQKVRSVGQAIQKKYGWTDREVTIAASICTVTVDMGAGNKAYYRRNPNYQWALKGGETKFSTKGNFLFQCGQDKLSGSADVLPLNVIVNDGDNMQIDISLTNNPSLVNLQTAFFLQGVPKFGNGGTGVTPIPTPGIYYSYPQVLVSGTVTVGGNNYTIESGTGWIDHQLMMSSLSNPTSSSNPNGVHPVPFIEDPTPYNGWVWQFYNLNNGQAFTGAGFILGEMNNEPKMSYGYFLEPDKKGGWTAIFINGEMTLTDPQQFPALCNDKKDSPSVTIPISRSYSNIENIFYGNPLSGNATPWYSDGTFNNPNGSLGAEFPADYVDTSGQYFNGLGYLETIGFQKVEDYRAYALGVLKGNVL